LFEYFILFIKNLPTILISRIFRLKIQETVTDRKIWKRGQEREREREREPPDTPATMKDTQSAAVLLSFSAFSLYLLLSYGDVIFLLVALLSVAFALFATNDSGHTHKKKQPAAEGGQEAAHRGGREGETLGGKSTSEEEEEDVASDDEEGSEEEPASLSGSGRAQDLGPHYVEVFRGSDSIGYISVRNSGTVAVLPNYHSDPKFHFTLLQRTRSSGTPKVVYALRSVATNSFLSRSHFCSRIKLTSNFGTHESIDMRTAEWGMYKNGFVSRRGLQVDSMLFLGIAPNGKESLKFKLHRI
jgi:hypothetical protein